MCIICIHLEKDLLTTKEARRNLTEMSFELDSEHVLDVLELINLKESRDRGFCFYCSRPEIHCECGNMGSD